MRDPKIVLKQLSSLKEYQTVNGLFCNLYNPEFYKIAYQNLYSKSSQMIQASDGSTIDGMSEERINELIQKLKNGSYKPTPLKKVNIAKKCGKLRKTSIMSFDDKLIQEIIRMLLEALYEPHFSEHSHGFRPKKSCHTALRYVQQKFRGTKWWIDADIKNYFDSINHTVLLNTLKKRIREQKFIHLINLFLKAGYIENWRYDKTYSGVPQGTIIGPILSNIYLDKFDKFVEKIIKDRTKGKRRKENQEYNNITSYIHATKNSKHPNKERLRLLRKKQKNTPKYDFKDPNFQRVSYIRYADDFIIGTIMTLKETKEIYQDIQNFIENELKLSLNEKKTNIFHNRDKIKFLGYELSIMKSNERNTINGGVALWVPYEVMKNYILKNRYGKCYNDKKTGKMKFKGTHRPELINIDELEILMQYNTKMRGLYNYYKMASNVSKLNNFNYICQLSFLRTLAAKYKTTCSKLYKNKNYCQKKHIGITYNDKFYEFFNGPFNVVKTIKYEKDIDIIENINKYFTRTSLIQRLEAKRCEFCGDENGPFEVHHVKKLKDLKGKAPWEKLMISRKRKTLVLCRNCHHKLHAGKL